MRIGRKTLTAGLVLATVVAGSGYFAYQEHEAQRKLEAAQALARDCDRCAERKAAGQRFREWLATQREQESAADSSQ